MPIRNTRLIERALRERWPIPKRLRGAVVATLRDVPGYSDASRRERVAACRALIGASKVNLDAIRTATLVRRLGKYDALEAAREPSGGRLTRIPMR